MKTDIKKAAALEYKHGFDDAPRLLAKGGGVIAEEIITIARREGISLHKDKNLVEIISTLDLNDLIPQELYRTVAEVLVFVYKYSGRM